MSIVYLATNLINGKRYIGVTKGCLEKRRAQHFADSRRGDGRLFCRALRKYGEIGFSWRVLHDYLFVRDALEAEEHHIRQMRPEYNMAGGPGRKGLSHGRKSIDKMRAAKLGKPNFKARGLKRSPEVREKFHAIGVSQRGSWLQRRHLGPMAASKRVRCINDGMIYESASAAARHYQTSRSALIELCLGKNRRKTVRGLRFEYVVEA